MLVWLVSKKWRQIRRLSQWKHGEMLKKNQDSDAPHQKHIDSTVGGESKKRAVIRSQGLETFGSRTASACLRSSQWQKTIAILSLGAEKVSDDGAANMNNMNSAFNMTSAFNMVISAWARGSHWLRSLAAFREMQALEDLEVPDTISFNACLSALERSSKWQHTLALLDEMTHIATVSPVGQIQVDARSISTTISACAKGGDWRRALDLFSQMHEWNITPDLHCHTALLSSFQRGKARERGLEHVKHILFQPDPSDPANHSIHSIALDLIGYDSSLSLCEAGAWQEALVLLDSLQQQLLQPSITGLVSLVKAIRNAEDFEDFEDCGALGSLGSDLELSQCRVSLRTLYKQIYQKAFSLLEKITLTDVSDGRSASHSASFVQVVQALDLDSGDSGETAKAALEKLTAFFWENFGTKVLEQLLLEASRGRVSVQSTQLSDIHSLGVDVTRKVLKKLKMDGDGDWLSTAEAALLEALSKSNVPEEPSARYLLSWVSYLVNPKNQESSSSSTPFRFLRSTGEIVAHGRHPHAVQSAHLQPIFSRHDRSQHSERRALLKVIQRLEEGQTQRDATGSVRLFSCHTPCISCLFVFVQFRAKYPKIRLTVAFRSWTETYALLQRK